MGIKVKRGSVKRGSMQKKLHSYTMPEGFEHALAGLALCAMHGGRVTLTQAQAKPLFAVIIAALQAEGAGVHPEWAKVAGLQPRKTKR